jgi:hypothetical protein
VLGGEQLQTPVEGENALHAGFRYPQTLTEKYRNSGFVMMTKIGKGGIQDSGSRFPDSVSVRKNSGFVSGKFGSGILAQCASRIYRIFLIKLRETVLVFRTEFSGPAF